MVDFLFGTSGWSYAEWVGPFYDREAKMLSHYSRFFRTVEINSTFYRYPTKSQIYGYYRASPYGFVFSAKLPKVITHKKKLSLDLSWKNDLFRFLELLDMLQRASKLGAILVQLPPSFVYERHRENLANFLEVLPEGYEFAVEFRDQSWLRDDIWRLLSKYNVAYTVVDEPLLPPEVHVTADFAYFRWHGRGARPWYNYHYSKQELKEWIPKILKVSNKVKKIYGYFNNHYHGYAPENCIEILEMLKLAKPKQSEIKSKIVKYNLQERPLVYEQRLDQFGLDIMFSSIEDLLLKVSDKARLYRGKKIKDEELCIEEATDEHILATIRNYFIDIDLANRVITHNCDDWKKGLDIKRMCKHLCKLFLSLPKQQSIKMLKDIIKEKGLWNLEYSA